LDSLSTATWKGRERAWGQKTQSKQVLLTFVCLFGCFFLGLSTRHFRSLQLGGGERLLRRWIGKGRTFWEHDNGVKAGKAAWGGGKNENSKIRECEELYPS